MNIHILGLAKSMNSEARRANVNVRSWVVLRVRSLTYQTLDSQWLATNQDQAK